MEEYKEGRVNYPTIMETSDFLCFEVPGVHKSRSSYEPYVIEEMSFEEDKYELVTTMKMLQLKIIPRYAVIGGHIGFYEILWKLMRYNNRNMHQAHDILREWAKMHLASRCDGT